MPIYEYRCEDCGKISELLTGIGSSSDQIKCSHCGGKNVCKLMSVSSTPSKMPQRKPGKTCCGADERCDKPPCSDNSPCCKN